MQMLTKRREVKSERWEGDGRSGMWVAGPKGAQVVNPEAEVVVIVGNLQSQTHISTDRGHRYSFCH